MRRFFLVVALLSACAGRRDRGGPFVLRVAVEGPLASLGPDTRQSDSILAQDITFGVALGPTSGGGFRSRVFDRWELVSPHRARVHLDPGARFVDGSAVTSEDVQRSLLRYGLKGSVSGPWLEIEPLPGSAWADVTVALTRTTISKQTPAGTVGVGPFIIATQSPQRIVLERRPSVDGRINRVELIAFKDRRAAFAATVRGDANATFMIDEGEHELLEGVPRLRLLRAPAPTARAVFMNPRLQRRLRLALSARIRQAKVGELAYGPGCSSEAVPGFPAALPDGRPLEVLAPEIDAFSYRAALAVRRALGSRGGEVDRVATAAAVPRTIAGAFDLSITPVLLVPRGAIGITFHTAAEGNYYGYSNPAFDAALDAGDYDKADEALREDPPLVILCRGERLAAVDSRIKNATLGVYGMLDTLPDWEVAP